MTDTPKLHDWVRSTLGHGEVMCSRCLITNREAADLGRLNECKTVREVIRERTIERGRP